ncbi:hypothetical protein [Pseudogracilibacillus auburnensis]|uniref:hypothetical protein n=1 Tax=Pseudogracilibacillus auburnensis TaxID=1494959 RepID=UPI001A977BB8|nr:hypothetical protein [Pseudogracilibacillus auburnensis]MBO1004374.1 hypothetical protein [Pseudogracilibacillus auburnensis]
MFKGRPLIIQFYHLFWKENYTKWKDSQDDEVEKRKFYTQNKDQFISEYASSHIAEDIAESFTEFVLKHFNKVKEGQDVKHKKMAFFYQLSRVYKTTGRYIK